MTFKQLIIYICQILRNNRILYFLTVLIFIGILPVSASNEYSLSIHKEISELVAAKSPVFIDNQILFTYFKKNIYIRRVAIAFASDNYSTIYPFMKNGNNVFFYARKIPINLHCIKYRFIVDGVWMNDPQNSNTVLSSDNFPVSSIDIPQRYFEKPNSPIIGNNKNVRFIYKDNTNKNVYISGNFNSWDPFMFKLKEDIKHPGTYTISLRLSPGVHYYKFIADGVAVQDSGNPLKAYNSRGNAVSVIHVD